MTIEKLSALEEEISRRAKADARRDVRKVFDHFRLELYHLGVKELDPEHPLVHMASDARWEMIDLFRALQDKSIEVVTREKAFLLAEEILRKNAAAEVLG
jgi:hypothetical protein